MYIKLIDSRNRKGAFFGKESSRKQFELRQKIGAVYDENCFFDRFTPDNISSIMKKIYIDWDPEKFISYRQRFNIPANTVIGSMSKGTQVKLCLAVALSYSPQILILDEITSCLDPVSKADVLSLFKHYVESGKNSVLFSTHSVDDLEKIANCIAFVVGGEIVLNVELKDLKTNFGIVRCPEDQYQLIKSEKTGIACLYNDGKVDVLVSNKKEYCERYCVKKPTIDETLRILSRGERL